MNKNAVKLNKNQTKFIGIAIIIFWMSGMLLTNNSNFKSTEILMYLPLFIGCVMIAAATQSKETPVFIRWVVTFIYAVCATYLISFAAGFLFLIVYGF